MTFFYKRIFPVLWFGLLAIFMAVPLLISWSTGGATAPPLPFFLSWVPMLVISYFIMKKMIFDLADEVLDDGDALIIRNGSREERVALANITNVSYSPLMNPPRVTLSLRNPSTFGDRITFCAPARFIPLASSPIIDDLIQRVDAARQRGLGRRGA
jgi:hypothetical protein